MSNKLCSARCFAGTFVVPEEASWWDVQILYVQVRIIYIGYQISHKDMAPQKKDSKPPSTVLACTGQSFIRFEWFKKKCKCTHTCRALRSPSHDTRRSRFSFSWSLFLFDTSQRLPSLVCPVGTDMLTLRVWVGCGGMLTFLALARRVQCYAATQLI